MLKKKKRFTSALLLAEISSLSAFVQGTNIVSAVSNTDTKNEGNNKGNQGSATNSTSGLSWLGCFFYGIKDYLFGTSSRSSEKPHEEVKKIVPHIALPSPEDFVSTIYDKNVEERAIREFGKDKGIIKIQSDNFKKLEELPEKRKNIGLEALARAREEFKKISEEKKNKYRVSAVKQENYETLIGIKKKVALQKIEGAKKLVPQLQAEVKNLEKIKKEAEEKKKEILKIARLDGDANELKYDKKNLQKIDNLPNNNDNKLLNKGNLNVSVNKAEKGSIDKEKINSNAEKLQDLPKEIQGVNKVQLGAIKPKIIEDQLKKLENTIKSYEEALKNKQEELKALEEISKISEEDFIKVPVNEKEIEDYEKVLYRAFEIAKVEGNNCSNGRGRDLKEGDYFKEIVGCSEHYFKSHPEIIRQCVKKDEEGNLIIKNLLNGREFCAGKFEQISLGTADKESKDKKNNGEKGKIRIIGINEPFHKASKELRKKVDASFIQAKNEDKNVLYVVASNFNAVELLCSWDYIEDKFITEGEDSYFGDSTQGPASALPPAASTISRHYLINMDKYPNDPSKWGQTSEGDRAINLLDGLGIKTKNGYIYDSLDKIKEVSEKLKDGDKDLKSKFKIGYHANVQVSADSIDFDKRTARFIYDKNKKINQVYVAAVSLTIWDLKEIFTENMKKKESVRIEEMKLEDVKAELGKISEKKVFEKTKESAENVFKGALVEGIMKKEIDRINKLTDKEEVVSGLRWLLTEEERDKLKSSNLEDLKKVVINSINKKVAEEVKKIEKNDVLNELSKISKKEDLEKLKASEEKIWKNTLKEVSINQKREEIKKIKTEEHEKQYNRTHNNQFAECRKIMEDFARQITKLNYETIFKAAVARGDKKVYVPLLGCGAFKNKYEWVIEEIKEIKKLTKKYKVEVVLNIVGSGVNKETPNFYKDVTQLLVDDDGQIDCKDFEVYEEKNGEIINVGEKILRSVRKDVKLKNNKIVNKDFKTKDFKLKNSEIINKDADKGFFQKIFCYFFD